MVSPGTYDESLIMWKPVQLQGWGAASTVINAVNIPGEKLTAWINKLEGLVTSGAIHLVPGQEGDFGGFEPEALLGEQGAGILAIG